MTHPDAPPVEPMCPTCGHLAVDHTIFGCRACHGDICTVPRPDLYRTALTAANDEIARLKAENEQMWASIGHRDVDIVKLKDERDALARDAERWRTARAFGVKLPYGAHDGWSYDGYADADADFTTAMMEAGRNGRTLTRDEWAMLDAARSAAPSTETDNA